MIWWPAKDQNLSKFWPNGYLKGPKNRILKNDLKLVKYGDSIDKMQDE